MTITKTTSADHNVPIYDVIDRKIDEINDSLNGSNNFRIASSSVVDTASYNYICDGVSDEVEINAAIAAASLAGGGIIELSSGAFNTTAPILLNKASNVQLRGQGIGSTVITESASWGSSAGTGAITFYGTTRCSVRDLSINMLANTNLVSNRSNGVEFVRDDTNTKSNRCSVERVEILSNVKDNYIIWNQGATNTIIRNNIIDGGASVYSSSSDQQGIEIFGGTDVIVFGNIIKNIAGVAILVQSLDFALEANNKRITISNNLADYCREGVKLMTAYNATAGAMDLDCVVVSNNIFTQVLRYGLYLVPVTGDATFKPKWRGVKCINNVFVGALAGSAVGTKGCYAEHTNAYATTDVQDVLIEGNTFSEFVAAATETGPVVQFLSFSRIRFINNHIKLSTTTNTYYSLLITAGAGAAVDCVVEGNTFDGAQRNTILAQGSLRLALRNNKCINFNQSGGGHAGIILNGTNTYVTIEGNRFKSSVLTSLGSLVNCDSSTAGLNVSNNFYEGADYTSNNYSIAATQTNYGTTTAPSAAATSVSVTTDRCRQGSVVVLTQVAGTANAPGKVTYNNGSFSFVISSAAGDETYRWHLVD